MKLFGLGTALAVSGCASITFEANPGDCTLKPHEDLIVDMHCHILNIEDADRSAFVKRHLLNTDESIIPIWDWIVELAVLIAQQPAIYFVDEAREERAKLRNVFAKMMKGPQEFCDVAPENQSGVLFAGDDRQPTGFLSNRARNAARYMATFQEVDLFLPSMVDFYEGDVGRYSSIFEQAQLYSLLSVASRGRMLPLISFHPERGYVPNSDDNTAAYNLKAPLKFIEYAVENMGFDGVKVHPSTGFAPIDNAGHGCSNYSDQSDGKLSEHQAK